MKSLFSGRQFLQTLLIAGLLSLLLPSNSPAKEGLSPRFERLRVEHGLSSNELNKTIQDKLGFLWFTSRNGISRFDGNDFRLFHHDPDKSNSLADNFAFDMIESRSGHFWIGYWGGGVSRFDPKTETFQHFGHDPDNPNTISNNNIWSVLEDRKGRIWIATDKGIDRLDKKGEQFTHFVPDPTYTKAITYLLEDQDGTIWATSFGGGLYRIDPVSDEITRFTHDPNNPYSLQSNGARGLYQGEDGTLWIGDIAGGIDTLSPKTGKVHHIIKGGNPHLGHLSLSRDSEVVPGELWFASMIQMQILTMKTGQTKHLDTDPNRSYGISSKSIRHIMNDREKGIWIATQNGVDHYVPSRHFFQHFTHKPDDINSIKSNLVFALHQDNHGIVWLGSDRGLDRFDSETGQFEPIFLDWKTDQESKSNHPIIQIVSDQAGNLLVSSNVGLIKIPADGGPMIRYKKPNIKGDFFIKSIVVGPKNDVWLGTMAGGLHHIDSNSMDIKLVRPPRVPGVSLGWIMAMALDSDGILWLGTKDGLFRYDQTSDSTTQYTNRPGDPTSLSNDMVRSLHLDRKERLWLGTNHGLDLFDTKQGKVKNISKKDGLPSNAIRSIQEDEQGNFWLGTDRGLARYNPETDKVRSFDTSNGVQGLQFHYSAATLLNNGKLAFGGANGFNLFDPLDITLSDYQPNVVITDFLLFNQSVQINKESPLQKNIAYTNSITLNPEQSAFSLVFSALNYAAPSLNRYTYKLEGFDKQWIQTDAMHRLATYTNLDPGSYQFQVRATNADGVWSPHEASLEIIILPNWWETIWFKILLAISALTLLVIGYQWRVRSIRKQNIILESSVKERTKALQKSENDLRSARDVAEQANRAKSDFLATATHELRTPLNGILGMAQLLIKQVRDDSARNYLKVIDESAQTLTTLVDDILDFSILDSGRSHFETTPFNPDRLIEGVIQLMEPRAEEKALSLKIENKIDSNLTLISAPARLHQILFNLIENALKFTDKGHVVVRTMTRPIGTQDQVMLYIEVEDTGIGVAPENQSIIFDLFQQVDQSSVRNHCGLGLGLATSKRIIDLLGGSITFSSELGKGSLFAVEIPCQSILQTEAEMDEKSVEELTTSLHILLVEDLSTNQKVAIAILESYGHQVMLADCGQAALKAVNEHTFDLILMDIRMPEMNGIHVTAQIRQLSDPIKAKTPIFAYTANLKGRDDYHKDGFDGVLAKPIRMKELDSVLRNEKVCGVQQAPQLPDNREKSRLIDEEYITQEVDVLGMEKVKELSLFFKEDGDRIINQINDFLDQDNMLQVSDLCHDLASAALNLGLPKLAATAKRVEQQIDQKEFSEAINRLEGLEALYDESNISLKQLLQRLDSPA